MRELASEASVTLPGSRRGNWGGRPGGMGGGMGNVRRYGHDGEYEESACCG
ncbi:MAG: hypothetical protein V8T87_03930 [Victivallales bacterium]